MKRFKKLAVRNESPEAVPILFNRRASHIMNWVLFGEPRGKEAIKDLFPIRNCSCGLCR